MPGKTSITLSPEQRDQLAHVARVMAAAEDRRFTLAEAIDRLIALWRSGPGAERTATP
jgi:hypothetical protein